jgi:hypothetical protein
METPTSGPRVDDAPVVVAPSTTPPDRPVVLGPTPESPGRSRRRLVLALVAVVVVLVAALAGWLLLRDDGGTASTRTPAASAGGPAAPAPLRIQVDAPAQVVAGSPATFVVHYTDGAGTFAGSTEDWGDAIGASSVSLGQCTAATPASPAAAAGTFNADHTWSTPGTYQVTLSAASYTCVDGSAVPEQVTRTLQVVVAAAS